jgi:hypothetical protein
MDKKTKWMVTGLIIGLVLGLIIGGIGSYFIHNSTNRNFMQGRGNFQIDDKTKNEITSFFNSTSDINTIISYCGQNRVNCAYYCRNINPNSGICKEITNSSGMGEQWSH